MNRVFFCPQGPTNYSERRKLCRKEKKGGEGGRNYIYTYKREGNPHPSANALTVAPGPHAQKLKELEGFEVALLSLKERQQL